MPDNGFDVDGARKAGYSDDEILQHLTSTRNFDVAGALKAGYSKQEVIQHLATSSPTATTPTFSSNGVQLPSQTTISARTPSIWENIGNTEVPGTGVTFGEAGDRLHQWIGMAGTEAAALFGAPAIAAAPVTAAATLGSGYLTGKAARYGAQQAGMGQTGQDLAEDAGNIAGGFGGNAAGARLPGGDLPTTDILARAGRNETGQLRPGVKTLARGVGAAIGHATGIPGAEIAGVFSGPSLADALIPARDASVAKAVPIRNSPYFDSDAYNNGRSILSRNSSPSSSAPTMPPTMPQGNPTPFGDTSTPAANSPAPLKSEGRPATWTNERVRELAALGDSDAIEQARLRGFGRIPSKFSETQTSPREVVHFDAEGNPIQEGGGTQASLAAPQTNALASRIPPQSILPMTNAPSEEHLASVAQDVANKYQSPNVGNEEAYSWPVQEFMQRTMSKSALYQMLKQTSGLETGEDIANAEAVISHAFRDFYNRATQGM